MNLALFLLKATQAQQQNEVTKMTDPEPPALSEDELTKILVTVSKTQLEGMNENFTG